MPFRDKNRTQWKFCDFSIDYRLNVLWFCWYFSVKNIDVNWWYRLIKFFFIVRFVWHLRKTGNTDNKCLNQTPHNLFLVYFSTYVPNIFATSKKNGPRPKWTIIRHDSNNASAAYTSICRGLQYLLKYRILSKMILTWPEFCFSRLYVVQKKYHKSERHLCLVSHSFTKLSQAILMY